MRVRLWLLLLAAVSVLGVGQLTFSGSWDATVHLLPTVGMDTELTLYAEVGGWKVGGTTEFYSADGYVWQTFDVAGMFGPLSVEWTFLFGPQAPAFLYTLGTAKLQLGGFDLTAHTAYVGPTIPGYFFSGGPSGGAVVVAAADPGGGMEFSAAVGFGARLADFAIVFTGVNTYTKTFPVDPFPGGLQFTYLELGLENLPFCCGITLDAKFAFTRVGFDYIEFTAINVPLFAGVVFDVGVRYGVDEKTVSVTPKWAGIVGCLTVWGDVVFDDFTLQGIELYGFRIRCELAECNYAEFLTAFNVPAVEEVLEEDIFEGAEFQYVKLGFCGPGCCGEQYTLELTAYFQPMGSLFGVRRLTVDAGIPIMANLIWKLAMEVVVGGPLSLATGWAFTF